MDSIWHSHRPRAFDAEGVPARCDVAVVGGGLAGVSAALELARSGADVVLLERGRLGGGASGRNAGFLLGGAARDFLEVSRAQGLATARLMMALAEENRHKVLALREGSGRRLSYEATGSFFLSVDDEEAAHLALVGEAMRKAGYPVADADAAEAGPSLPEAGYGPGLFFPADGQIHPLELLYALAEDAHHAGALFAEEAGVEAWHREESGLFVLKTAKGPLRAPRVVLAVNAFLPGLLPASRPFVEPVRGQVLATKPLPRVLRAPVYADRGYRYNRQLPDGTLVVGGYRNAAFDEEKGTDLRLNTTIQGLLDAEARRIHPEARARLRWAGIMGMTPDGLPLVGEYEDGLFLVAGFSGHGVALAPILGEYVAQMVTGVRGPLPPLHPSRFPGEDFA